MANSLFSPLQLVMLSALCNVAAQLNGSYIKQGSCLSPTETSSWLSPSGLFSFGFFPQGNNRYGVGIVAKKTVVWTANRDDPPVSEDVALYFTMGRFILVQQSQNLTTDVFNVEGFVYSASMLDTGNFVLYDNDFRITWQSFDHPTDTILPGQFLSTYQELFSSKSESDYSTGRFRLKMQSDSNTWAPPTPGNKTTGNKNQTVIPVLAAGIGGGLAAILVFLLLAYWGVRQHEQVKKRKLKENFFKQNGGIMLQQLQYQNESTVEKAKIYTEEELMKATNNFNEGNVIGQGGYGVVYKGVIADAVFAIKKSKVVDRNQIDQFANEVVILSQITHPNVVKLLGCCLETPVPLLVYEFVTNNTLFHHLHDEGCALGSMGAGAGCTVRGYGNSANSKKWGYGCGDTENI